MLKFSGRSPVKQTVKVGVFWLAAAGPWHSRKAARLCEFKFMDC